MVRIRDVAWALAAFAVATAGSRPALADPISLTGFVATDFTTANHSTMIPVNADWNVNSGPGPNSPNQLVDGYDIQNIWLHYDANSDTMSVGIQGYQNVAGKEEISGNGSGVLNPSGPSAYSPSASVAVAFASNTVNSAGKPVPGSVAVVAGVPPSSMGVGGNGTIDGFTVSAPRSQSPSAPLQNNFGQQLPQFTGNLAFNPTAAHPDLEFTIKNFSQIPGLSPNNGFFLQAYSGAPGDIDGEVSTIWYQLPAAEEFHAPEPTTWLAWTLLAGGAAWQYRRRRMPRA